MFECMRFTVCMIECVMYACVCVYGVCVYGVRVVCVCVLCVCVLCVCVCVCVWWVCVCVCVVCVCVCVVCVCVWWVCVCVVCVCVCVCVVCVCVCVCGVCVCVCVCVTALPCSLLSEGVQKGVRVEELCEVQSTLLQQRTSMPPLLSCPKGEGLAHKRTEVEGGVIRSLPEVTPGQRDLHRCIHCEPFTGLVALDTAF